jgi:hypothetical protein
MRKKKKKEVGWIIYRLNNPYQYNDEYYSWHNYKLENTELTDAYSIPINIKQQQLQNMHTIPKKLYSGTNNG